MTKHSDPFAVGAAHDPLLFGANTDCGLVAAELHENKSRADELVLFYRDGACVREEREPFRSFLITAENALAECPVEQVALRLKGAGELKVMAQFVSWKTCNAARQWLSRQTGFSATAPGAPYFVLSDPIKQHFMLTGRTLFKGMNFEDLHRMQVDIECFTSEGYEFCNAAREGDRIIAIAMSDATGWRKVLAGPELDEKTILERFVETVRERDPDVIEGHNIFNFDLPYIAARAKQHKVKLTLGRDGSVPRRRASRFSVAERVLTYERFDIFGRHIVDTLFLVQAYDVSHRSLGGFGLKEVAQHFGVAPDGRTYIEGAQISEVYKRDPETLLKYVYDDVLETGAISNLLSRSSFLQTQMLPESYQNVCVRGNATRIDGMLVREYVRQGQALPLPQAARAFEGAYTDMFRQGVIQDVHHCDVRSLYPSLMLVRSLGPRSDELGVFLKLLEVLRRFRVDAKQKMQQSRERADQMHFDALQSTFKILINSFYGYLGFAQGRFNDFDAAENVTGSGRELLRGMIQWLRAHGADPIEIDTDGIYFVPPPLKGDQAARTQQLDRFRAEFTAWLPAGIEIEFDGEYRTMYSYKMKNYALLEYNGEMIIKGAALKSRGLELFQREFLSEVIRLHLEGEEHRIPLLKASYEKAIREHAWPIEQLAKTETLVDSPATYKNKLAGERRARSATYELALSSKREYRAGDQVSYYVTGNKKSIAVHSAARLVSDWDPANRDENVPYYLAKLDALYQKFGGADAAQGELAL